MRMYGFLKEPYQCNKTKTIYKVMIHEISGFGVYTYYYTDRNAAFSSYDSYHENLNIALEEFTDELDERGWIEIGDPLPYCINSCVLPVRVKGCNLGQPQRGKFEILFDGKWVEYIPPVID